MKQEDIMIYKLFCTLGLTALIIFSFGSCNQLENNTNSSSFLIVELITGTDLQGNEDSTTIFSDVIRKGSVFNDAAKATMRAQTIDPNNIKPSYYQDVVVDQIDISYSRTDGLSVEGKDVPFGFSQKVNALMKIGEKTEFGFVIIQHVAKMESPLVELLNLGEEQVLKLEAKITFHSKDLAGNRLAPVTGSVSIWCADFADPE